MWNTVPKILYIVSRAAILCFLRFPACIMTSSNEVTRIRAFVRQRNISLASFLFCIKPRSYLAISWDTVILSGHARVFLNSFMIEEEF